MKKNATLAQVIQDYFDKIDDYQEAKDEFINDVNIIFKKKGDSAGVMCRQTFDEAYATFTDMVN